MSLDLTGSYFNNDDFGYAQQNATDVMATNARAVLFVFMPYQNQFGDVGLRPFQYQFDENFLSDTQQINDLAKRGTAHASSLVADLMSNSNLNDYMTPSIAPTLVLKSSNLSDRYRFILILTDTPQNLIGGQTLLARHSSSAIRRIYTGFFEDEPFNPTTFSTSRRTLNPNAFMVITHKTIVGTSTQHGQHGSRTSVNTQASEEILNSGVANMLVAQNNRSNAPGIYLMTPDNCVNSIDTTDSGYSISVPGAHSDITKDVGVHTLPDLLEQPMHNVAQIVKGMIRYQDDVTARSRLSTHKTDMFFDDSFLDDGIARTKLSRYMQLPQSRKSSPFDLDLNARISPVDLDNLVEGQLDVVDFDLERPQYYETADQMEMSITNQYSFLIASVIGPILNAAGLNALQFEYQVAVIRGSVQDNFRTHSAEPNWPVPQNDLLEMAKAVEFELTQGIFKTIFASKGDFHVAVSANTTGMTVVRLSLVGQGYRQGADFEIPTCMGGLVSPLIGDLGSNVSNSESIEQMYGIATGVSSINKSFNDDDRAFMAHAENMPWNQSFESNTFGRMNDADLEVD